MAATVFLTDERKAFGYVLVDVSCLAALQVSKWPGKLRVDGISCISWRLSVW